jgi:hypothetical protein
MASKRNALPRGSALETLFGFCCRRNASGVEIVCNDVSPEFRDLSHMQHCLHLKTACGAAPSNAPVKSSVKTKIIAVLFRKLSRLTMPTNR